MEKAETYLKKLFSTANIVVDGKNPWDIKVLNKKFYHRVLSNNKLGLGESYMDGWWECDDISEFICRALRANINNLIKPWKSIPLVIKSKLLNMQHKEKAHKDVGSHYNMGNILFQNMLDKRLTYSSGYWKNANNLDEAQEAKLELICKKIGLKPKMKVLDIGCGWGSFVKYACEKYDVKAVGITLSEKQVKLGHELCKDLPIEIRLKDYRDVNEKFDRIVSIGMVEHVGYKNYRNFMEVVSNNLHEDGIFLLHTIGSNNSDVGTDGWTNKYIFPNGALPSILELAKATEEIFVMEDWHNFSFDYSKTLDAWFDNFNKNWEGILSKVYDNKFYRMWKYYIQSFSGSFKARHSQLWQIVYSKNGVAGGYNSIR